MPRNFHQATFDKIGKRPLSSRPVIKVLEERERALGITFPSSLRECFSLKGASRILEEYGYSDVPVPIDELGDPEELEHGVIRFLDDGHGMGGWYVLLDGSDDPPVVLEVEGDRHLPPEGVDDWTFSDVVKFHPEAEHFSEFVSQRVFTYGYRGDRKAARKLKPYHGSPTFDEDGRATEVHFSGPPSVNGVPLFQRPVDASVMNLLRRLVHLRSITFFHSVEIEPSSWVRLRGHPGVERIVDQGSIDDHMVESLIELPALREISLVG